MHAAARVEGRHFRPPSSRFPGFQMKPVSLIHRYRWLKQRDAANAIGEYIEVFYNNHRLHSSLGYTSPAEFEAINSNPLAEMAA
jgi:transposase InsO family protein